MLYKISRFLTNIFVRIFYPFKVINKKNLTNEGNTIEICNHLGKMDVVYVDLMFKGKSYVMAKKEWFKNKFLAKMFSSYGAFPVDREGVDLTAMRTGVNYLKNGKRLIIFPEGTRNKTDAPLLPLKDGTGFFAYKCNSTIIPLTIYKKAKIFRKNYVYVGEPFKFTLQEGQRFNNQLNVESTKVLTEKLMECREKINEYIDNKKKKWNKK